jgi:hypothetical protein
VKEEKLLLNRRAKHLNGLGCAKAEFCSNSGKRLRADKKGRFFDTFFSPAGKRKYCNTHTKENHKKFMDDC